MCYTAPEPKALGFLNPALLGVSQTVEQKHDEGHERHLLLECGLKGQRRRNPEIMACQQRPQWGAQL